MHDNGSTEKIQKNSCSALSEYASAKSQSSAGTDNLKSGKKFYQLELEAMHATTELKIEQMDQMLAALIEATHTNGASKVAETDPAV